MVYLSNVLIHVYLQTIENKQTDEQSGKTDGQINILADEPR